MSGKHFSSSWLAVDSFTSAPLSITVRYGAVACVKPVGFTRRAASDPIAFPFPLSNGSDQNHKHEPVSGLKSVQKGGERVNCFHRMNGERTRAVSHNFRIHIQLFCSDLYHWEIQKVISTPKASCMRQKMLPEKLPAASGGALFQACSCKVHSFNAKMFITLPVLHWLISLSGSVAKSCLHVWTLTSVSKFK